YAERNSTGPEPLGGASMGETVTTDFTGESSLNTVLELIEKTQSGEIRWLGGRDALEEVRGWGADLQDMGQQLERQMQAIDQLIGERSGTEGVATQYRKALQDVLVRTLGYLTRYHDRTLRLYEDMSPSGMSKRGAKL